MSIFFVRHSLVNLCKLVLQKIVFGLENFYIRFSFGIATKDFPMQMSSGMTLLEIKQKAGTDVRGIV